MKPANNAAPTDLMQTKLKEVAYGVPWLPHPSNQLSPANKKSCHSLSLMLDVWLTIDLVLEMAVRATFQVA